MVQDDNMDFFLGTSTTVNGIAVNALDAGLNPNQTAKETHVLVLLRKKA